MSVEPGKELQTEVWGCGADITAADIELPRALVMQKMSKLVDEGAGKPGQIIDSIDRTVLGGTDSAFEAIIFTFDKVWTVQTKEENKFIRSEPVTPQNANDAWEFEEDGKTLLRSQYIRFYCLRAGAGLDIPLVISLGRTSFNTGRRVLTVFQRMSMQGLVSAARVINFKTVKQEKDGKAYYVVTYEVGRETTPTEIAHAKNWFGQFAAMKDRIKVHEDEVETNAAAKDDDLVF